MRKFFSQKAKVTSDKIKGGVIKLVCCIGDKIIDEESIKVSNTEKDEIANLMEELFSENQSSMRLD